jgi:hypothetical protein
MPESEGLQTIPSIGPKLEAKLKLVGIEEVADLVGRDPEALYEDLMQRLGRHVDRCVLYSFRCAVHYASTDHHDPEKLKWWTWKD